MIAEAGVLRGRRRGNLVIFGSDQPLPVRWGWWVGVGRAGVGMVGWRWAGRGGDGGLPLGGPGWGWWVAVGRAGVGILECD